MTQTAENQKPTILLTGCSGLIGEAVIDQLSGSYNIVGLDIKGPPEGDADFVEFDITSDESVEEGLAYVRDNYGGDIASVVHLAAFYDFSGEPSPMYDKITVEGTRRLLRHVQDFNVEQFLFSSTMLVHKPCEPGEKIDENWPIEAKWPYPESKVKTEKLLFDEHGDVPVLNLRIAGVYTDYCDSIPIAQQIKRIYEKEITSHVYPGDTGRGQSFVHLEDLVDAIERSVDRRDIFPDEFAMLIGEEETLGYDEIQRILADHIHGQPWRTFRIPKVVAQAGAWVQDKAPVGGEPFIKPWMIGLADDHYALDISRAREALDWEPQHSLRETLPKMAEALHEDPVAWYEAHDLEPPRRAEKERRERRRRREPAT